MLNRLVRCISFIRELFLKKNGIQKQKKRNESKTNSYEFSGECFLDTPFMQGTFPILILYFFLILCCIVVLSGKCTILYDHSVSARVKVCEE